MSRKSDGMSTGMAILCTLGILLFIGWMIDLGTPKCIKSGCNNDAREGSSYCYLHDNSYYRHNSSGSSGSGSHSSTTSTKSSTYSGGTGSNSTSGTKNTHASGSSSSNKNYSSNDSYDEGYNAIYEDDDYDWDRYWSDDDYAAGVDDAMEDEDW